MQFVKGTYYEHDDGTKFYELTQFKGDDGFYYVVRRWGKIALAIGGGQIKVGKFSLAGANSDMNKEHSSRLSRGYAAAANVELGGSDENATALNIVNRMGSANATKLIEAMGVSIDTGAENDVVVETPAPPPPPIDRGEEWASW